MSASKRNITDYLPSGPGAFFFHKQAEGEDNYNYYGFMHRSGNSYIMRENIPTSEVTYTDGGHRLSNWEDRANQTYVDIFSVTGA